MGPARYDELHKVLVKRFGGTITLSGRRFRRFITYPGPVNDGTSRCIACGQIDEPEIHQSEPCQVARWWPDAPPEQVPA